MRLENTSPGHNKWFSIDIIPTSSTEEVLVVISWGPMGSTYKTIPIYRGNFEGAEAVVQQHIKEREKLGYVKVQA